MTEADRAVPQLASFVLRVRTEQGGSQSAWLDDERITVPDGVGIHRALVQAARERADRTDEGRTIRVLGIAADGTRFHLAIEPDGTPREVPPPAGYEVPADQFEAAPVNAFQPVAAGPQSRATGPGPGQTGPPRLITDDLGRPIPTTTTQASAHPVVERAPEPAALERSPEKPATTQPRPSRRALLLGGASAVALAGATAAAIASTRGGGSHPAPSAASSGTPLPGGLRSPAGMAATYLWSVVKMSDVAPRLAVTETQLICTVDNDATGGTQLLALDAASGRTQWKADLPVDAIVGDGPTLTRIDGVESVVLITQSQIIAYPLSGGDAKTWPFQRDWTSTITPGGLIVTKPEDKTAAYVLYGDQLAKRVTAQGANPVVLLADGTVVALDQHGHVWRSDSSTKAPKPTMLLAPAGTTPGTFVAATPTQLITAFVPKSAPAASRLRVFALPDLTPRLTTDPIQPAVFPSTFMLAPDQSWAVAGNTWLDLRSGSGHVITPRWSPIAISQYNAWSRSDDNVLTTDARGRSLGPAKGSGGQVVVPRGGTAKLAFCVASTGGDATLYAVPIAAG